MRLVAGLLLVLAALLKFGEVGYVAATSLPASPNAHWLPIQAGLEFGAGLLVLSGVYWRQVRWLTLLLFLAFALYSLILALNGAASCGCFGPIEIHPWWTLVLDVAVVLGLLFSNRQPSIHTVDESPVQWPPATTWPSVTIAIAGLAIMATALVVWQGNRQSASAGNLSQSTAGDVVILNPTDWIGQPLPIAKLIDVDLSHGEWIVLLHRHDCPECQAAIRRYERLASESSDQRVALVEVPPYGEADDTTPSCRIARLSDERTWFVTTPVEIQLVDGMVVSATRDLPALPVFERR